MLGDNSAYIGMTGVEASALADQLCEKLGITPGAMAQAARDLLSN